MAHLSDGICVGACTPAGSSLNRNQKHCIGTLKLLVSSDLVLLLVSSALVTLLVSFALVTLLVNSALVTLLGSYALVSLPAGSSL